MASVCPYHSKRWRGETQHLINTLRGKLFQARYVKRFRRVICSCEGKPYRIDISRYISNIYEVSEQVAKE